MAASLQRPEAALVARITEPKRLKPAGFSQSLWSASVGLDDPKRIPVGAKDAKSLVRAEGGSTRNVGKVAGDKAFQHTDRNDLKRTYVDRFHNGYRKTAKALGLDQQVTKKPPIAKASDIRKPSKKPGV